MIKKLLEMQKELENDSAEDSDEPIEFNDNEVKSNLINYSSERLCDVIITYRYFGLNKDLSISAMEELAKRRSSGDEFLYENYIDKNLKELPSLNFNIKNVDGLIQSFRGTKRAK